MKRLHAAVVAVAAAAVPVFVVSGPARAADSTFTLQCGSQTYTVTKGNENAASYSDGTRVFVNGIGAIKTDGRAQPTAVLCTINGFGPIPFIITPAH